MTWDDPGMRQSATGTPAQPGSGPQAVGSGGLPGPGKRLMDRVWLAVPYVLLVAGALPSLAGGDFSGAETVTAIALGLALAGWHTWWVVLHPDWPERRLLPMGVYFAGLLALAAGLFHLSFSFFPLYLGCYAMAFVALPGGWAYAGVAITAVVSLLVPGLLSTSAANLAITAAGAALACVCGGSIRALESESQRRREANDALAQAHSQLRHAHAENLRLRDQLVAEAREAGVHAERARLAAEIHDTVAAGLTGILAQLEALDAELPDASPQRRRLTPAIELTRESLQEARRSVGGLRPRQVADGGLPRAFASMVDQTRRRTGLAVELEVTGTIVTLRPELEDAMVRAAQEALTNVVKHARADHAYVTLSYLDDQLAVDVADDGVGMASERPDHERGGGHHGRQIMSERLASVGGCVEWSTTPGHGTTVTLTAAYRRPDPAPQETDDAAG